MLDAADFKNKTPIVHFQTVINVLLTICSPWRLNVSPLLRTLRSASELQFRAIVKTEGNFLRIFIVSTCTVFPNYLLLCVMSSRISISSLSF